MCLAVGVRTSGSATVWTMNSSVLESVKEAGICVGFSAFFTLHLDILSQRERDWGVWDSGSLIGESDVTGTCKVVLLRLRCVKLTH